MPLTRDFRLTIFERAQKDVKFRQELLIGALNEFLAGDLKLGKAILRDYINATISFNVLAKKLHKNSKSLQRMLGPQGNPTMSSLASMLKILQKSEGIHLQVRVQR